MTEEDNPDPKTDPGDSNDGVEKLLAEYKSRGLVPEKFTDEVQAAIEAGKEARALRIIVKRRRQSRQENLSDRSE
jgi:hypothetical protein